MKKLRYSISDDKVIADCIHLSNLNIDYGCEQASVVLDRTKNAVLNRYYRVVRYNHQIFASIGGERACNTKNVWRGKTTPEILVAKENAVYVAHKSVTFFGVTF